MKYLITVIFLLLLVAYSLSGEPLTTGVVEFEEKNDIGLDNAGIIIPEVLVSHLKNIGKYKFTERILLKKVLEEQALQMSGIIDEDTAGEVGKLFGLEAVITGSAMKIGDEITISGRVIKTETAEIIASGTIEFTEIDRLKENLEKLAYLLSGYSEDDYQNIKVSYEISKNNYGLRLGSGYARNSNDNGFSGLLIGLFYQGEKISAEFNGIPPVLANVALINPAVSYFPFTHVGFGASFIFCSDELSKADKNVTGEDHWHGEYMSVLLGINLRASEALRGSVYMGPTIDTAIMYQDEQNEERHYSGGFQFGFPPPAITVEAEYWFPNNMSLRFLFIMDGGDGVFEGAETDTDGMSTMFITLSLGYKFSIKSSDK